MVKVVFFQIKKSSEKLLKISQTATNHFENKKHLLFMVPDEKVLKYVDDLLWNEPKFSFLPHVISDIPCDDLIVITQKNFNPNRSLHIFNLTQNPIFDLSCSVIYEFDDSSDNLRFSISQKKFNTYKEKGFFIEAR